MARVLERVEDSEEGTLPRVCVRTGEPAGKMVRYEFVTNPG
jgi:hypothetical protein